VFWTKYIKPIFKLVSGFMSKFSNFFEKLNLGKIIIDGLILGWCQLWYCPSCLKKNYLLQKGTKVTRKESSRFVNSKSVTDIEDKGIPLHQSFERYRIFILLFVGSFLNYLIWINECQVQKRPNLPIISFKKAKSSKMKTG